ncbi:FAD-dependent oxidoreductase [Stackebrandtia soli]|uniref:FAD-dependent oxidoreductase n=1 Tax=Stackebrandtia soli TaxID=1892856 RepID=UPI0039E7A4D3
MSQVLIIGAGPTGLSLACGLARYGLDVRVVDRATGPAQTSRANILHAGGAAALRRLGALGDLPQQALEPLGLTMYVDNRPISTMRFTDLAGEPVQALFVSQAQIERRLRDRFAELGGHIEWSTQLTGLTDTGDGVVADLDGRTVTADYVVGCDGAHSTVRGLAGIGFPGVPVAERFLLADVHLDWERDRTGSAGWFHRDGMLLAIPMRSQADDLWRLMGDVPDDGERLSSNDVLDRIRRMLAERTGESGARIRSAAWTSVFRIHRRLADTYRRGRVLLAGDAAHIHSPIGGQGITTGIGDAENLAWKLGLVLDGRADPALLDTYPEERRPIATEVLDRTTGNTRLLLGEGAVGRFVRDRLVVPMLRLPAIQHAATRRASQLWISYRSGPLGGGSGRLRSGDRVTDRDCRTEAGERIRLHDALDGGWVLLADTEVLRDVAAESIGDRVRWLRLDAEGKGPALLVRPDGYLAWRGEDPSGLRSWLTRITERG